MKHIVYKFDDDQRDEMDFDSHGTLTFATGEIISKRGMAWKIESVEREKGHGISSIPTYWIYLSRVVVS